MPHGARIMWASQSSPTKPVEMPGRRQCTVIGIGGVACDAWVAKRCPISLCEEHLAEARAFLLQRDGVGFDPYEAFQALRCAPGCSAALLPEDVRNDDRPAPIPKHAPVVYYVRFGERIKIGTSTNFYSRMRVMPHDEILALEPGDFRLERMRHDQFAAHRTNGEWFCPHPDLLAHTRMLVKHYGRPDAVIQPSDPADIAEAEAEWRRRRGAVNAVRAKWVQDVSESLGLTDRRGDI